MQEQQQKKQLQGKPASIEVSCSLGAKIHFFDQLGQPEQNVPGRQRSSAPFPSPLHAAFARRCIRSSAGTLSTWDARQRQALVS
jgi:hypothetical protein